MQAAATATSRVASVMAAEAAAEDAINADGAGTEALVTATAEARTVPTLVRAPAAPSASRVDSVMAAEAAADNPLNPDAIAAEPRTVLTLVQAAATAASRVHSVSTKVLSGSKKERNK